MPLKPGKKNIAYNIREMMHGPMHAKNVKRFGKRKAQQIVIAAAYSKARGK